MWYIWLGIVILLALIEVMTVNLTTIWFVISGLVALLISFAIDNFFVQFGVFVVLGILLLVKTKAVMEKWLNKNKVKTNLDRIIGMEGVVTEDISKNIIGEVRVDGKNWSAKADKKIKKGSTVNILKIEGVKVIVEEVK
jgi:Membrane protein implicated in regulation of membrane protease activity